MHTILESNYTAIKLQRNRIFKEKKFNNMQLGLQNYQAKVKG